MLAIFSGRSQKGAGFTIAELMVIVIVIGILASLSYFSIGAWRDRVAETEVKNDLNGVAAAMENARNWGDGYPVFDEGTEFDGSPATTSLFTQTESVTLTYAEGDAKGYCIDAVSKERPSISMFMSVPSGGGTPKKGTCAFGEDNSGTVASGDPVFWKDVTTGGTQRPVCAISQINTLFCSSMTAGVPQLLPVSGSGLVDGKRVKKVTAGQDHVCAIAEDSGAYCWGSNDKGQLGNGSLAAASNPVRVSAGDMPSGPVKDISAGFKYTCAIASDNKAYCWGSNNAGQLGRGTAGDSNTPVAVVTSGALNGKSLSKISSGVGSASAGTTCALTTDNWPYCWGYNYSWGLLGKPGVAADVGSGVSYPVEVASGAMGGRSVADINVGSAHVCTHASDNNRAYCWGYGYDGAIGDGSMTIRYQPALVSDVGEELIQVDAGSYNGCSLTVSRKVYCWGHVSKLGGGSSSNSSTPIRVNVESLLPTGASIKKISVTGFANMGYAYALDSQGNLYLWRDGARNPQKAPVVTYP